MALLVTNATGSAVPQNKRTATRITSEMNSLWRQMKSQYTKLYNDLWNNKDGLTPQEVLDGFGTEAGEFLTLAYSLYTFINTLQPGALSLPAQANLTINQDGTVTVTPEA